jgi:hypothetical protein
MRKPRSPQLQNAGDLLPFVADRGATAASLGQHGSEPIRGRIERITQDIKDLEKFFNIEISPTRAARLREFYEDELSSLVSENFQILTQDEKVDYVLLRNWLENRLENLKLQSVEREKMKPLLEFSGPLIQLCEDRQAMKDLDSKEAAFTLDRLSTKISETRKAVEARRIKVSRFTAFRASRAVNQLQKHLEEWFGFYNDYDPMFTWWMKTPFKDVVEDLINLSAVYRRNLVGLEPGDEDAIIGEPIGRDGLMAALKAELIAYTPEELIKLANIEYDKCLKQMNEASKALGFDDWKLALESVKNTYVEPGKQPALIRDLAQEATDFVTKHDLVTVPKLASGTWRMFMMSPERQKVNPFFLGGDSIIVSYPTSTMSHLDKLMSMRGNNPNFSRSTVFHEMIPGHRLQMFMMARYKAYRLLFMTPFAIEGWAFYWEMVLWDDDRFVKSPENRIGMLFWRMHRCARIIFSLKFHLGKMSPDECIDLLVDMVGHERMNAGMSSMLPV